MEYFKIHFLVRFLLDKFSHFPCQVAKVGSCSYQSVWPSARPELKVDSTLKKYFLIYQMAKVVKSCIFGGIWEMQNI